MLIDCQDGSTERRDYGIDHWEGPSEDCIGWWRARVPDLGKGRVFWAPKNVLLAYFEHVQNRPETVDLAFVTGLLLVQKKILSILDENDSAENLVLYCRSKKATYTLPVVEISSKRLQEIQDELSERLFMDQPIEDEAGEDDSQDSESDPEE